jgi:hypothetical protein
MRRVPVGRIETADNVETLFQAANLRWLLTTRTLLKSEEALAIRGRSCSRGTLAAEEEDGAATQRAVEGPRRRRLGVLLQATNRSWLLLKTLLQTKELYFAGPRRLERLRARFQAANFRWLLTKTRFWLAASFL